MLDVVMALVSAALIVTPSYVAYIMTGRFKISISIAGVLAIAMFLVGVFLMIRLLKD
jgi:ABC-type Mn2+/Zn2+ transport system permease subunit